VQKIVDSKYMSFCDVRHVYEIDKVCSISNLQKNARDQYNASEGQWQITYSACSWSGVGKIHCNVREKSNVTTNGVSPPEMQPCSFGIILGSPGPNIGADLREQVLKSGVLEASTKSSAAVCNYVRIRLRE
jgi:hypothetical protein